MMLQTEFKDPVFAAVVAFTIGLAIGLWMVRSYKQLLVLKAGPYGTAERLPDGKFYYIVAESQFNELRNAVKVQDQPIGYVTSDAVGKLRQRKDAPTYPMLPPEHIWHSDTNRRRATVPVYLGRH